MIRPRAHIACMAPYTLADMTAPAGTEPVSLAQNESLRPPSPEAIAAATQALAASALYPDPDWTQLRHALARCHDIPADGILCGAGSLDLIGCLARVYAGPDAAVLAPAHAYPFFRTAAAMAGARFDTAAEVDLTVDIDALLGAVRPDTRLVFVANPGNPTGTRIPSSALKALRAGLPDIALLVIDEAYGEFADHLDSPTFPMVADGQTVVLRTFSKAYGLAGWRIGWGLFPPDIAGALRKVMNPNNVTAAGQAAAAAAVADQAYMAETCALTAAARDHALARLQAMGLGVRASFTNFLLIDLGTPERALAADAALRAKGLFLRRQAGAGLPQMLRMTLGPAPALDAALTALAAWTQETPA